MDGPKTSEYVVSVGVSGIMQNAASMRGELKRERVSSHQEARVVERIKARKLVLL